MGEDEYQGDEAVAQNDEQEQDLPLSVDEADDVRGGLTVRKSGGDQMEYLL
jgi:hypothetical protein